MENDGNRGEILENGKEILLGCGQKAHGLPNPLGTAGCRGREHRRVDEPRHLGRGATRHAAVGALGARPAPPCHAVGRHPSTHRGGGLKV